MTRKLLRHNGAGGFTLIEILVVVAIIALLISILLPSLKAAREEGRAAVCGSQMSQIFKGTFMYTNESGDMLPFYGWLDGRERRFANHWWPTQVTKSIGGFEEKIFTCPSDQEPYSVDITMKKGTVFMYRGIGWAPPGSPIPLDLTYRGSCDTLRTVVNKSLPESHPDHEYHLPRKVTDWKRPHVSVLLIEASAFIAEEGRECYRFEDATDGITEFQMRNNPHLRSWLRHRGSSNILFLDSHVERLLPEKMKELAKRQEHDFDNQ